jgi:hypothetical protein
LNLTLFVIVVNVGMTDGWLKRHRAGGIYMTQYFSTGTKKGRGMAPQSLDLIEAMRVIAETTQPITGRGVGYKLFT